MAVQVNLRVGPNGSEPCVHELPVQRVMDLRHVYEVYRHQILVIHVPPRNVDHLLPIK